MTVITVSDAAPSLPLVLCDTTEVCSTSDGKVLFGQSLITMWSYLFRSPPRHLNATHTKAEQFTGFHLSMSCMFYVFCRYS